MKISCQDIRLWKSEYLIRISNP